MRLFILFVLMFIISCGNNYNKEWVDFISNKRYLHSQGLSIVFDEEAIPSIAYRNSLLTVTANSLRVINFELQKAIATNKAIYSISIPFVASIKVGFEIKDNKLYSTANMLSPIDQLVKNVDNYVDWNNLYLVGEEIK